MSSFIQGGNIYESAAQEGVDPAKLLDFSASINPLGVSPKAWKKILRDGLAALLHYPDSRCAELRQTLAQRHGIPEHGLLPGSGSAEFIHSLPRVLEFRSVLLVTPAFGVYENALEAARPDCRIHFFETREEDGFELDVEGLMAALTQGYDALYLGNPNNPTGILTEKKDLLRILSRAEREETWMVLDEAFIDFIPDESLIREALVSSRLILLRSLTAFFAMPGLRCGYLVSNPEIIRKLQEKKEPWTVNALAQLAAVESLRDRAYIDRTLATIRKEREHLASGLQRIRGFIPYPGSANYLLVQLHPSLNLTAAELHEMLIQRGILIRDFRSFRQPGSFFFRIAVRSRRENNFLLKTLRQIVQHPPF